jgi:hypothetical protein
MAATWIFENHNAEAPLQGVCSKASLRRTTNGSKHHCGGSYEAKDAQNYYSLGG